MQKDKLRKPTSKIQKKKKVPDAFLMKTNQI